TLEEKDCADRTIAFGNPESCHSFGGGVGRGLHGQAVDMADLAGYVSNWTDHPVIDTTGLTGMYNIQKFRWVPQLPRALRPDGTEPSAEELAFADPSRPTIFDIFDTLGLKLDSRRAQIETIIVISAQTPTEN